MCIMINFLLSIQRNLIDYFLLNCRPHLCKVDLCLWKYLLKVLDTYGLDRLTKSVWISLIFKNYLITAEPISQSY